MFEVGFQELVLLFVIGLLVLGPERLPKVATLVGRWVGRARRTASQLRHQLEREIALAELEERRKAHASAAAKPGGASEPTDAAAQKAPGSAETTVSAAAAPGGPGAPTPTASTGERGSRPGVAGTQDPSPSG